MCNSFLLQAGYLDGPFPWHATSKYSLSAENATVFVYIDFKNADRKLRKPLIVFEGFDPGIYTKPKEKEGRTGIRNFIDDIESDRVDAAISPLEILLRGNSSISPSVLQQYDIVYVNWKNGTDYIQNNVLAAIEVISAVNRLKAAEGSTEPNVVLGKSMGSLIARMALRQMENDRLADNNKPRHNTRLYISVDGGQQGSNIPQGYQHLANHFRDLYIQTGPTADALQTLAFLTVISSPLAKLSVNETPAARQITINHVNPVNNIDNSLYTSFMTELRNLGYPQGDGVTPFRKVAVSNGSECAKPQPVGSGGNLLAWSGKAHPSLFAEVSGISGALVSGSVQWPLSFFRHFLHWVPCPGAIPLM